LETRPAQNFDRLSRIVEQKPCQVTAHAKLATMRFTTKSLRLAGSGYAGTCQPLLRKRLTIPHIETILSD